MIVYLVMEIKKSNADGVSCEARIDSGFCEFLQAQERAKAIAPKCIETHVFPVDIKESAKIDELTGEVKTALRLCLDKCREFIKAASSDIEVDPDYVAAEIAMLGGYFTAAAETVKNSIWDSRQGDEIDKTCEDESSVYGRFLCSECGCEVNDVMLVYRNGVNYCPCCGRLVMR